MPSGKIHDFLAITSTVGASYFLWNQELSNELALILVFAFSSLFGGLMFGPDLDTKSVQYKRWGLFRFMWLPYQAFGHRSKKTQSHDALFGPLVRITYFLVSVLCLSIFVCGVFSIFNYKLSLQFFIDFLYFIVKVPVEYQIAFLCGLWFGNVIHYLADWVWEFTPKRLKN